jgi:hypothetical protein
LRFFPQNILKIQLNYLNPKSKEEFTKLDILFITNSDEEISKLQILKFRKECIELGIKSDSILNKQTNLEYLDYFRVFRMRLLFIIKVDKNNIITIEIKENEKNRRGSSKEGKDIKESMELKKDKEGFYSINDLKSLILMKKNR